MNKLEIIFEPMDYKVPENVVEVIKKAAAMCFVACKIKYDTEINLIITNNAGIEEYNRKFRDVDNPTDVLSFPLLDYDEPLKMNPIGADFEDGVLLLGDIILSYEKALEQAEEYGHSIEREAGFLMVHGVLHLFGYDHIIEDDEKKMLRKQKEILEKAGILR